ncbi:hypothetical protein [Roseibium sp.]|uniref:hypothetical protein n=1 Tax=Roseibium sp. TaxID=1936156 RepID=UPI003B5196BB
MRKSIYPFLVSSLAGLWTAPASADQSNEFLLEVPAQDVTVDLQTGLLLKKGVTGQCIETVSNAGGHQLIAAKSPGDDHPTITVNGEIRPLQAKETAKARLGTLRLLRDGSLISLRTWKTGDKQTELLKDGEILLTWKRGIAVKLIRARQDQVTLLLDSSTEAPRLITQRIDRTGSDDQSTTTLVEFESCQPERLRLSGESLWARMSCPERGSGLYKISLETGEIGTPVLSSPTAEFVSLPKRKGRKGLAVATLSGSQSAMQFYYAVTGLLLGQTGEVRACSSDAEGLQSWNQSYRTRALAKLYRKTKHPVFAALAQKSIRLTLAAQNGATKRSGPSCAWSSTIYSKGEDDRLNLMINQAMIANALSDGCNDLAKACPTALRSQIAKTQSCLAETFEPDFDNDLELYRIAADAEFRFAGAAAPWNWQTSFAGLLSDLDEPRYRTRAKTITEKFLASWSDNQDGSLWRYWPDAYHLEKGRTAAQIAGQRYEDTGHAGISLLSLAQLPSAGSSLPIRDIQSRLNMLLASGVRTPRDLDGAGPKSPKWFPAGGWANFATDAFRTRYTTPIPNRSAADSIYAYAQLFDPMDDFSLSIDVHRCTDICRIEDRFTYSSWMMFLDRNPFFKLSLSE